MESLYIVCHINYNQVIERITCNVTLGAISAESFPAKHPCRNVQEPVALMLKYHYFFGGLAKPFWEMNHFSYTGLEWTHFRRSFAAFWFFE